VLKRIALKHYTIEVQHQSLNEDPFSSGAQDKRKPVNILYLPKIFINLPLLKIPHLRQKKVSETHASKPVFSHLNGRIGKILWEYLS